LCGPAKRKTVKMEKRRGIQPASRKKGSRWRATSGRQRREAQHYRRGRKTGPCSTAAEKLIRAGSLSRSGRHASQIV
jgi:hypothetical protein